MNLLIDNKDKNLLVNKWTFDKSTSYYKRYTETRQNGKRIRKVHYLHRVIMGAKKGEIVDHINCITTDNRRENLRIVSKSTNTVNSIKNRGKVGFRGVYFNKNRQKFHARIKFDGITHNLGFYESPDEAGAQYQYKRKELFSCL